METEVVLLQRFSRTGDAEAFGEIIRRHAGLVYGAAWRILADMDRAGDVAQETFLQLTKDAAKVTGSLPGWLHRVATHKAIDLVRRDASRKHRETQYAARPPREVTRWREISSHVDEGLNALDSEMREILVAHFLEGQTTRQIAGVRGISQATVSRRLEAGVVTLRGRLRKRGLLVAAGTLSMLLGENAVNAAPAILMSELGKMALVGGQAAMVCSSTSGLTGAASSCYSAIGGALTGVKTKAVAATVVAAISVGSVVTYRQVTRPTAPEMTARSAAISGTVISLQRPSVPAHGDRSAIAVAGASEVAQEWEQTVEAALDASTPDRAVASDAAPDREPAPVDGRANSSVGMVDGGMMGGFAMASDPLADSDEDTAQTGGMMTGAMGVTGGGYVSRHALRVPGPNDANDPNDTSARNP